MQGSLFLAAKNKPSYNQAMTQKSTMSATALALLAVTTTMQPVHSSPQTLSVKATLKQKTYRVGEEIKPAVALVNSSDKDQALSYLKPFVVTPEIWDASTNSRLANAPSVIFSQMRATQNSVLKPGQKLDLTSFYVVVQRLTKAAEQLPPASGYRSYWYKAKPGKYFLRYRIQVKDLTPDAQGEVVSKDLPFELLAK